MFSASLIMIRMAVQPCQGGLYFVVVISTGWVNAHSDYVCNWLPPDQQLLTNSSLPLQATLWLSQHGSHALTTPWCIPSRFTYVCTYVSCLCHLCCCAPWVAVSTQHYLCSTERWLWHAVALVRCYLCVDWPWSSDYCTLPAAVMSHSWDGLWMRLLALL
jgi:hypothetical protein